MWIAIFGAVIICAILCVIYLTSRFARFAVVKKGSGGRKSVLILLSLGILILSCAVLILVFDTINCVICVLHLTAVWLICDLILFIIKKLRKKEFKRYFGWISIIITAGYMSFGWYLAHHVVRTDYSLTAEKQLGGLRIVQFADSHIGSVFDTDKLAEYIDRINAENPDVVLITGDFVDDGTSREEMTAGCGLLGRLETRYGVYFCFGNHDKGYYSDSARGWTVNELRDALKAGGVRILEDESVLVDNRFYIIGRRDRSEESEGSGGSIAPMEEVVKGLDRDKYMIVMDHQPYDYEAQAGSGVDLVLSGHTHGGQFIPIIHAGEWMGVNCRTYGYERRKGTDFIVTSGIGDWAIKFKTGCKAEYVVIDVDGN